MAAKKPRILQAAGARLSLDEGKSAAEMSKLQLFCGLPWYASGKRERSDTHGVDQ
jgi:hypothetical protein